MTCNNCVLRYKSPEGNCFIFNKDMTNGEGCPSHITQLIKCNLCGNYIVGSAPIVEIDDNGNAHNICGNCAQATSCQICANGGQCLFETSSDPTPKFVNVTRQQGSMTIQTQERNPQRIEVTCKKCPCYFNEICGKDQGYCNNLKIDWRN